MMRPSTDSSTTATLRRALTFAAVGLALFPAIGSAEEGGSGHYLPGSLSSFVDGVPPKEGFIARINVVDYQGSNSANQPLPIAGVTALGVDAAIRGYALSLAWRPPVDIGDGWSYAMSATFPVLDVDVSAIVAAKGVSARRTDSITGLGDIVVMPLMLNYTVNPDFNVDFRVAAYLATGKYQVGRLANTGKNFWTIEPTVGLKYFGTKNGREASLYFGADFNAENKDTNYKSGTQLRLDGTLAQHFPALGGLAGVGLSAYYYQQVTGDSGTGANFGEFKGKSVGLGPAISYVGKLGSNDLIAELKWLHENETEKRLKGDIVWLKGIIKF